MPSWWLGRVPVGRTSGSVPLPEAPAHCLGWVQLVSQSCLLAQAESAAVGAVFSPLLQPVPSSVPSSLHAQGSPGRQGPQGHTAGEVRDSPMGLGAVPVGGVLLLCEAGFPYRLRGFRAGLRGCPMAGWARPGLVSLAPALSGSPVPTPLPHSVA